MVKILVLLQLIILCRVMLGAAMVYKRNQEEKYEADLVAVSSTVIPLSVIQVSYGETGQPSEEYKAAYIRKLQKQIQLSKLKPNINKSDTSKGSVSTVTDQNPDDIGINEKLITVKSKRNTDETYKN